MQIKYVQWRNREDSFELIEEFLNEPMNFGKLIRKSKAIDDEVERLESEFIFFEPVPTCEGFGYLINDLILVPELYSARLGEKDE